MEDSEDFLSEGVRAVVTLVKAEIDKQVAEAAHKGHASFSMPAKDAVVSGALLEFAAQFPFPIDNKMVIKWLIKLYAEEGKRAYQDGALFRVDT